ncbi:MAG: autotransporter outer membrane beta-barrel domain-containing protein [Hyphomicrobiales bacterium]|nr:MAG: autotransporter outer membrane beta-barrel domain-containing protein [Hyphomicrobiales bacterium]
MTELSLNAGAVRTAGRAARVYGAGRVAPFLFSGVSLLTLAIVSPVTPVSAAAFTAANQSELYQAITDAQASDDPSSTITLTGSFTITSPPPAIAGKTITIAAGANTLTYSSAANFNVATGATLTLTGNIVGAGGLNPQAFGKLGAGQLIINGVTASGISRLGIGGGSTLVNGGSVVTFGTSQGGTVAQLGLGTNAGEVASLTISGSGTKLVATGSDPLDIGGGTSQGILLVENQGHLETGAAGMRTRNGTITVDGAGSAILAGSLNATLSGKSFLNIQNGGLFASATHVNFGASGTTVTADAALHATVTGAGSKLEAETLYMQQGTLQVTDGGIVTATSAFISNGNRGAVPNFAALVSGAGSELRAATMTVGTTGTGTLTIANDGKVVVNDTVKGLELGGTDADSNAVLNIGGAVGQAAEAAGTLEALAITLAATAEINFNHTETGYVFDLPINGTGAINQVAGRTIFNDDQLGFAGLTTISGGMLEVNGELGGTVNVTGGTLAGTGIVGSTSLAAGGAIAPGSNGIGMLTIDGDYTGTGGLLQIQTVLGGDGSLTDLLTITGNSTGTTNVSVTNFGGSGGLTVDGIKIIDVGGTSDGTFSLLGDTVYEGRQAVIGGAYLYGLHQGTLTDADGDWYLRSILNPDDETPVFQPAAPVIETYAAAALQAFNTTETLQQRVGNRSWSAGTTEGNGLWGRIDARHTALAPDKSTTGASYEVDTWRLQAGADGVLSDTEDGSVVAGVNLQAGTISAGISSASGDGGIEGTAFGLGGTLTWYGNQGFYLDAQGKLNWFDSTLSANLLDTPLVSGNAGFGYALSLEAGQQLALGDGWSVTPQAQLAYSSVDFESFDSYGSTVALKSGDSLVGRLGISADYETEWQETAGQTGRTHFYGIANLTYEFLDGTATSVGADTLVNEVDPLWGSIGLGGSVNWAGDALSLYGEANLGTSLNHLGDSYSLGVTAGIRGKL